jgi:hypothetical protein
MNLKILHTSWKTLRFDPASGMTWILESVPGSKVQWYWKQVAEEQPKGDK